MASFWLLKAGGALCAVEAGEGLEVGTAPPLFRPPLSDPALAGLAPVDDCTLVVADLGACIGAPLVQSPPPPHTLFRLAGDESSIGFLVRGEVQRIELADGIQPLPRGLRQPRLRGCVLVDGLPVPLIDLVRLQHEFAGVAAASALEDPFSSLPGQNGPGGKNWRCIRVAGHRYALPKSLFPIPPIPRPPFAALPGAPAGVAGLFADGGVALPAWRLGSLLGEETMQEEALLVGGGRGCRAGVLVEDEEGETVVASPLALPPWGRRSGIEKALVIEGEIVPCLRLRGVAGPRNAAGDAWPGETSPLPFQLSDGPWEIGEFLLGGGVHAVPKAELIDVLPLLPWRRIPGLPAVVEGVALWRGILWPVANLTPYFGPAAAAGNGCMLALQREGHRLLLPVERFAGNRLISPGEQRRLPIELSHPVVAGCYLGEGTVNLVLDLPGLVHHFEPSVVERFRSLVGGEREEWPQKRERPEPREAAEPFLPAEPGENPFAVCSGADGRGQDDEAVLFAAGDSNGGDCPGFAIFATEITESLPGRMEAEPVDVPAASTEESPPEGADVSALPEEEERGSGEVPVPISPAEPVGPAMLQEPQQREELHEVAAALANAAGPEPEEDRQLNDSPRAEVGFSPPAEESAPAVAGYALENDPGAMMEIRLLERPEPQRTEAPTPLTEQADDSAAVFSPATVIDPVSLPPRLPPRHSADGDDGRRLWPVAAALLLLVAASLAVWLLTRAADRPAIRGVAPQADVGERPREAETVPGPVLSPEAAAALPTPTPPARPAAAYTVIPGDTLWSISGRYLRNPLRYGDLARINRIVDPDLIYPGQVIRIGEE